MPIPEETIQQILSSTDIVELVEGYFPLQKKGQDFWAVCPFHSEKSPSFKVSPTRQAYYCFGCNAKGNAIGFVMNYENLDFPSAVKRLGSKAGITVQEDEQSPETKKEIKLRKDITKINREAGKWFHEFLMKSKSQDASNARNYLKERKISNQVAKDWQIGLAPANSNEFSSWARDQGFSGNLMKESGLMSLRDEDSPQKGLYARFRNRIMFPLNNDFGETIAFSGRTMDAESKIAKYVNSPETLIFKKSNVFFGLDKTKRAIAKQESVIICEGQIDLIRCYENGIENIVAPLGTAFTENHSRILRRFTGERGEALLCFDSDSAGYKAAIRAYNELSSAGIYVRAIELPPDQDPDSLITNKGTEDFLERINNAKPFYLFQIETLSKTLDLHDPKDRVRFANEISPSISVIKDSVARETMINDVATRLGISSEDFRKRVAASIKKEWRTRPDNEAHSQSINKISDPNIRILMKLALTDEDTQKWISESGKEHIATLETNPESDALVKIWKNPPASILPEEVNAYLATKMPNDQDLLTGILVEKTAELTFDDAQKAIIRLKIKDLQNKIDANKTKVTQANLSNHRIIEITGKVESQRKELVDFKIALENIAGTRE
ncbi:MAG: DNA primase [Verrucomicrobiota bacterium]|nr:DNA primase [Verrucomicrobiota bacterium]